MNDRTKENAKKLLRQAEQLEAQEGGDFTIAALTGSFSKGTLSTFGDASANGVTVSRDIAGKLLINNGAVAVSGGLATVANTSVMQVFGQGGDDTLALNEANGALPRAHLFGGSGNDSLTGGSGADLLFAQSGKDVLLGKGGNDQLFGGADDDILTGGDGDDQMFGEAGNDRMIWNPGDDDDLMEGGDGIDTAEVNGNEGAEIFAATVANGRVAMDRVNPAPFKLDIGTTEKLVVNMNGGDDVFSATGNLGPLIQVTVDGGAGNDTIQGGSGADLLLGGDGNDVVNGGFAADKILLGAGDDVAIWNVGGNNDVIEGGSGVDTLLFNGSGLAERIKLNAAGERVVLTRDPSSVAVDLNDIETVELNAFGAGDRVDIENLSGTDVGHVRLNLGASAAEPGGDGQADTVVVRGSVGADDIDMIGLLSNLNISGLPAFVEITGLDGAARDTLGVFAGDGDDNISALSVAANVVSLTLEGGAGNDTISGSQGANILVGGTGNDVVFGDDGDDTAFLGSGDDVFEWAPGDGNDVVEGDSGHDTLLFGGSNASEKIDIVADGSRTILTRDVGGVTMNLAGVETVEFRALGGVDTVSVGDMTGTDVTRVEVDLRGNQGGGDGAADTVFAKGTAGDDLFAVVGIPGDLAVTGLPADVAITGAEAGLDRLVIDAGAGNDIVDAFFLDPDAIQLTINGGLGSDTLLGSNGDDVLNGGDGADLVLMEGGDDTFVWNPGDDSDVVMGQDGFDTMLFNGVNAGETIDLATIDGRVQLTRNIDNVVIDLAEMEAIELDARGGADTIRIGDLSGTGLSEIDIDLGGLDGEQDTIVIDGTDGEDAVLVIGDDGQASIIGLATQINLSGFEAANDRVIIRTKGGDDLIEATGVGLGSIQLTLEGGAGDDVLLGGDGNDVLLGGEGNDILFGGGGFDFLDSGPGADIDIQGAFNPIFDALLLPPDLMIV